MMKNLKHNLVFCAVVYLFIGSLQPSFSIDPTSPELTDNIDSILLMDVVNVTADAKITKQINGFYSELNKKVPEKRFDIITKDKKNSGPIQFGEIVVGKSSRNGNINSNIRMWGEVDQRYELQQKLRNYTSLLNTYESQLLWAEDRNNSQIAELMNVKIKKTKLLLKEYKRELRKY